MITKLGMIAAAGVAALTTGYSAPALAWGGHGGGFHGGGAVHAGVGRGYVGRGWGGGFGWRAPVAAPVYGGYGYGYAGYAPVYHRPVVSWGWGGGRHFGGYGRRW